MKEYSEGSRSYQITRDSGKEQTNPYRPDTIEFLNWNIGWERAKKNSK